MSLVQIAAKLTDQYVLTASLTDALDADVLITAGGSVALYGPDSALITDTLTSHATGGDLSVNIPNASLTTPGVHRVRWTGTSGGAEKQWDTYFEFVAALDATPTALLPDVKTALRVTSTVYDDEIEALILAAKADLLLSGVSPAVLDSPAPPALVKQAIITYCRAFFGLDNPDAERYMLAYRSIENALALSAEYQQVCVGGITGSITAGTDLLTVDDADAIEAGAWLKVAGAAAGGGLLVAKATAVSGLVVTLSTLAGTTVSDAAVTVIVP